MRSYGHWLLQFLVRWGVISGCFVFSTYSFSQQLSDTLVLRLGPGIGFPVNIALPSGTEVHIEQRRNHWLLIHDERGEGGWAKIEQVDRANGLAERQAWRLSELKKDDYGAVLGRVYQLDNNYGVSLGWRMPKPYQRVSFEAEKTSDAIAVWQAVSSWYELSQTVSRQTYYGLGLGLGYAWENAHSQVFSQQGKTAQTGFAGIQLLAGYRPLSHVNTGISVRHLRAVSPENASANVFSWFWSFGI